jgi:ribonucleoside-diphosphate reductase alpha chain
MAVTHIPTDYAKSIAERQYFHKDREGKAVEDFDGMFWRVAYHVARAEAIDAYRKQHGMYPKGYNTFEGRTKMFSDLKAFDAWVEEEGYTALVEQWAQRFYHLLVTRKFVPGGRILTGAASKYNQMQNCFVISSVGRYIDAAKLDSDSIDGIYEVAYELAKITKTGGGNGVFVGNLRESGAYIEGSGGVSSGPVSFLRNLYNPTLRVIRLEGIRRGAGMCTMQLTHPDALDFLTAKDFDREAIFGTIEAFNISFLAEDDFMDSVEIGDFHEFKSIVTGRSVPPTPVPGKYHLPGQSATSVYDTPGFATKAEPTSRQVPLYARWTTQEAWFPVEDFNQMVKDHGLDSFEFSVPARWLFEEVSAHAWLTGDPGILYVDRINEFNPMIDHLGEIMCTNPCGEEPLFPHESCDLGSAVLSKYVKVTKGHDLTMSNGALGGYVVRTPTFRRYFDYDEFRKDIATMVRFLDNVLTMNTHPLAITQETCDKLRRVGLGVMGDADMAILMRLGYASEASFELRENVLRVLRGSALTASQELAKEKEPFPLWIESSIPTPRRNLFLLSIAPTGTISIITDVSSGIEPNFGLMILRRVGDRYLQRLHPAFEDYLRGNRPEFNLDDASPKATDPFVARSIPVGKDAAGNPQYETEMLPSVLVRILDNHGSIKGLDDLFSAEEQVIFQTAHDVSPEKHVAVQGLYQRLLDGDDYEMPMASISKTINLPESATVEDVQAIYRLGYKERLKGITMYRDGSRKDQVLRTDSGSEEKQTGAEEALKARIEELEAQVAEIAYETRAEETPRARQPRRGRTTQGEMYKAEFRNLEGAERKAYVYVGVNEDRDVVEVFIEDPKAGEEASAYREALSIVLSTALKFGVPAEALASKLLGIKGGSISYAGGIHKSVPDLVAKRIFAELDKQEALQHIDVGETGLFPPLGTVDEEATVFATGMQGASRIVSPWNGNPLAAAEVHTNGEVVAVAVGVPRKAVQMDQCVSCLKYAVPRRGRGGTCPPCEECGYSKCS